MGPLGDICFCIMCMLLTNVGEGTIVLTDSHLVYMCIIVLLCLYVVFVVLCCAKVALSAPLAVVLCIEVEVCVCVCCITM